MARFDPSAAAKESLGDDEIGSGAGERLTEAARMETETSVGSGLTKSGRKTVTRTATAERDPETSGKEASTAGVKPKSKTAGVTGSKTPRRAASDSKIPVTEWKRGVTRKVGDLKNELVKEKGKGGGTGSARGSGNGSRSGLEMVGDVVSGLSPQVLKYLDADLLQRLTSASKGTRTEGKRRGGDGEKEGKRKRGQLEGVEKGKKRQRVKSEEPERGGEKETGDSGGGARGARSEGAEAKREERGGGRTAEAKKERQEASRKKEKRGQRPETREEILGVGAREKTTGKGVPGEELTQGLRKRKHRDSGQEDGSGGTEHKPRQETADAVNVTGQNVQGRSNEAAVGGPPEDTTGGLSVEERKRLKREKRAQRRGSEAAGIADAGMDRLDAGTDRLVSPTAAPVKQEVFVNPNWRALVGYVGGGKPTFSLASVLGGVADAGPSGPSDGTKASVNGQNAVANTVSGIDTHAADENSGAKTEFGVDLAPVRRNASEGPTGGRIPLPDAAKSSSAVIAADPPAGAPRHDDVSTGGSLAAGGPGDEDLGLSFVRSATAEQEWMASKSALAIDYKRKKRIAARVAPGGGKKRG